MRHRILQRAALVAVLVVAFGLRVGRLENVPAGLYCDEAGNGYNAYALGSDGIDENGRSWPLYVWSFGVSYKNPAFIYAAILPVKIFGLSAFSVRLTAALFGTATVWALFSLGRALYGPWVGLWAALFLALCPWYLHFSRIAFELIAFPCLFTAGCICLARFTQGWRTLPVGLGLCALCVYAYAPAALFVPLFLLGFAALYARTLLRHWPQLLLALVVTAAVLAPAAVFFSRQAGSGTQYFRATSSVDLQQPWQPQVEQVAANYARFFSASFLFEDGDPIVRHSVRGFGELYPIYAPFLLLGIGAAVLQRQRFGALLLWWLALYPVAPSLMNEIPSASRGIIGAPIIALLTGLGFAASLRAVRWLAPRRRWAPVLQAAAALAVAVVLAFQVGRYLRAYFVDYPTYAALTPGGFQFGYRDVIAYMESERANYDVLLLSYTDANQPQVFAQFYRPIAARDWAARKDAGYVIARPDQFALPPGQRVLAALHPLDIDQFSDLDVKREVRGPGGKLAFVVAELKGRKRYLSDWLLLGPFPNDDLRGMTRDAIDPVSLVPPAGSAQQGVREWRLLREAHVGLDLNRLFAATARNPGNPELVCAYAATTLQVPSARQAILELGGSVNDTLRVWLNGQPLTVPPLLMGANPKQREVDLRAGDNGLLVQSCEDVGDWWFNARLIDAQGHDMEDIASVAELPVGSLPGAAGRESDAVQLLEGFAGAARGQREDHYPDYRGGARSWRARVENHSSVRWQTAAPPVAAETVFAFTGSTSDESGQFRLFVDGREVLTFESHADRDTHWWHGERITLVFFSKASAAGNSGVYLLFVPADLITPGRPLELRVEGAGGDPLAWFMLKEFRDTGSAERLSPAAVDAARSAWRDRPLAFTAPQ